MNDSEMIDEMTERIAELQRRVTEQNERIAELERCLKQWSKMLAGLLEREDIRELTLAAERGARFAKLEQRIEKLEAALRQVAPWLAMFDDMTE